MNEDHNLQPSQTYWNANQLKQYVDQRFADCYYHYDSILKAKEDDTERTRQQMELRLNSHNDLVKRFPTKGELRASVIAAAAFISAVATTVILTKG
jgi:hypothetical protein